MISISYLETIAILLRILGYDVEWRVVNAADYGAAQRRRRTFIFAYRNDTMFAKRMSSVSSEDILGKVWIRYPF